MNNQDSNIFDTDKEWEDYVLAVETNNILEFNTVNDGCSDQHYELVLDTGERVIVGALVG